MRVRKPQKSLETKVDNKSRNAKFVELLTPNYYKIHSFVLALVPNRSDAEDVLQSSITYMLEHFDDFQPGTNFLSWAFAISKYQALRHRKNQQRSKVFFSENVIQIIESESQKLSSEVDLRLDALKQCLKKLQERDVNFLQKRFETKRTMADLADELGISANILYKRLARIKSLLLECIRRAVAMGGMTR